MQSRNQSNQRHYDITLPLDNDLVCVQSAKEMVHQIRPDWSDSELKHEFFTNGITNKVLIIWSEKYKLDRIVFRIYGIGTELILDRNKEIQIMQQLHNAGCAPPIFGTFNNGVAYGYFPGVVLDKTTVQDARVEALVAESLARMHCVPLTDDQRIKGAGLVSQIQKFMNQMPSDFDDHKRDERYMKEFPSPEQLQRELAWIEQESEALQSPLVMCHNDLSLHNVVYNKDDDSVRFIDYEYACQNFQAFDIATNFVHYAGSDSNADYTIYPDRQQQLAWLNHYLTHWRAAMSMPPHNKVDLEMLYVQVNRFAPICHFYWATWAVGQAAHSTINFDFCSYAFQRISWYFKLKKKFTSLEFPQM